MQLLINLHLQLYFFLLPSTSAAHFFDEIMNECVGVLSLVFGFQICLRFNFDSYGIFEIINDCCFLFAVHLHIVWLYRPIHTKQCNLLSSICENEDKRYFALILLF